MKPGEVFNPWRRACGFYPPDVVSRLLPFMVVQTRRKFSDGHKRLYTLLVRRWGREGPCFPSQEGIAKELAKSERCVRMLLEDLVAFGLISRRRRGRAMGGDGQSDEYIFLWHPIFDRQESSILTGKNRSYDRQDSAVMTGKNEQPLYKEETRTKETRTSSEDSGRLKEQSAANGAMAGASANQRAIQSRENQTSPAAVSAPRPSWPMSGWESAEDFEAWWDKLVQGHPNKSQNGIARTMAIELVVAGTLDRAGFEAGYAALRRAKEQRWTKEHGRYAENLWQLLDDRGWKFALDAGPPRPPVPEYQSADDYIRRIQAE